MDQKLINRLRVLLIKMAIAENLPEAARAESYERERQYLEGYFGIKRHVIKTENAANIIDVLDMTGINTKGRPGQL